MGAAVCHCSVSSVLEVSPKPAALLIEQWHAENPAAAKDLAHTRRSVVARGPGFSLVRAGRCDDDVNARHPRECGRQPVAD